MSTAMMRYVYTVTFFFYYQSDSIVSNWGIRQDRLLYLPSLHINTIPHTRATHIHRASAARGERGSERKNTVEHLPKTPKGLDCSLLIPLSQHVPTLKYLSAELVFGLIWVLLVSAFVPPPSECKKIIPVSERLIAACKWMKQRPKKISLLNKIIR